MVGGDLNPKEIEKAIQDTKESVTEILKVHESFVAQLNRIPAEIDEIQDAIESLAISIDNGTILAKGLSARKRNLTKVNQCYRHGYRDKDPIKSAQMKELADENDETKQLVSPRLEEEEEHTKQKVPLMCKMSMCSFYARRDLQFFRQSSRDRTIK